MIAIAGKFYIKMKENNEKEGVETSVKELEESLNELKRNIKRNFPDVDINIHPTVRTKGMTDDAAFIVNVTGPIDDIKNVEQQINSKLSATPIAEVAGP